MRKMLIVGLFVYLFSIIYGGAEDFVVQKKRNVVSISSLKESCISESSYALQKCARLNKDLIDQAIEIFEGKKMSKTELESCLSELIFINKQLDSIEQILSKKTIASPSKK